MRFSATTTGERLLPERLALRARPLLEQLDELLFSADERGAAKRMSLVAFSIRIVSAAIAFLSQVLLARWMGGFEFGIYVLVWVTMIIIGNLSCFGFQTAVIRYIPQYREKNQLAKLRGVLITSPVFALASSTLVALAGGAAVLLMSDHIESYYIIPFCLGIVCLPMLALSDVLHGISRANSQAIAALAPIYIIRPVLILIVMVSAIFAGYQPSAKTAIISAIVATYLTTLIQILGVKADVYDKVPAGIRKIRLREWLAVSLPIFLVEGFFFLLTNADVLMVGRYMQPGDVAIYFASVKTLALVHFVYFAVKAGVAQRYARFSHGDKSQLASFARDTVTWTFWPSLAMALLVLALGKPILGLFGPDFQQGYPLLFVLAAGIVARAAVGPAESLLTMSGNQKICAAVYAATLALNICLNILLIPLYGLMGTAIATGVAMVFEAVALSLTVWFRLGFVMVVFLPAPNRTDDT